jgi:hypothetical protein
LRDIGVYGRVTLKGNIYSGLRMLETPEKYTKPMYTKNDLRRDSSIEEMMLKIKT